MYRRSDLARWSKAVDRHVGKLVEEGVLIKSSGRGNLMYLHELPDFSDLLSVVGGQHKTAPKS